MFSPQDVNTTRERIAASKHIVITAHKGPDGDAVGSTLGLQHFLHSLGKEVTVIMPDPYADFLNWLPGQDQILILENEPEKVQAVFDQADLLFVLDYNHLGRVGELGPIIEASGLFTILIDHHQQPDSFPDILFSDTKASSTCELVYELIDLFEETAHISPEAATCLYTGIMTDSGSFRFPSTTPRTHRIIASLMECGAENAKIHQSIYDTNSYDRLKLLGYTLDQKMKIYPEHRTVILYLDQGEMDRFNFQKGDTEGFVNYGLSIKGIVFSAFIREKEGKVRMSLRSKGDFSVNEFARAHYEGGGHTNAAGGKSDLSLEETVEQLASLLPQYNKALNS